MFDMWKYLENKKARRIIREELTYKITGLTKDGEYIELKRLKCKSGVCILLPRFHERVSTDGTKIKLRFEVLEYEV